MGDVKTTAIEVLDQASKGVIQQIYKDDTKQEICDELTSVKKPLAQTVSDMLMLLTLIRTN